MGVKLTQLNKVYLAVLDAEYGIVSERYDEGSLRNLYNRTIQEVQTLSRKAEQAYIYFWANPETINEIGSQINYSWTEPLLLQISQMRKRK